MKEKNKTTGFVIRTALLAVIVILFAHPDWLPLGEQTAAKMKELTAQHFNFTTGNVSFASLLVLVMMICVVWLVCGVLDFIITHVVLRSSREQTVAALLLSIIKYGGTLIGIVWGFSILGADVTTILAGLGIISLIIGFGAQSLIEDIITGVFIIFEGQYSIGDVIVLDDFRGTVRRISVRTTTIEDTGGNLKIVNNSDIRNLQNRSVNSSLAICDVDVAYSTDLRKFEALVPKILPPMLEAHKDLYLAVPIYKGVQALGESGVTLRFTVDVKEDNIFIAQRALNRDLKVAFDDNGVEIPFPQVVVHQGD